MINERLEWQYRLLQAVTKYYNINRTLSLNAWLAASYCNTDIQRILMDVRPANDDYIEDALDWLDHEESK